MNTLFDVLRELELEDQQQREKNLPAKQRNRQIDRSTGQFLSMLVRLSRATHIIEIGTSVGYSTIWLGLGAKTTNGHVITYEVDKIKVTKALENIRRAGLSDIIDVRNEDPRKTTLTETDFVFLDAEKQDYIGHFNAVFTHLVSGGIVVADNVLSHQEVLVSYLEYVRTLSGCNSQLLPLGRGLELTYKFKKDEFEAFNRLFSL